VRDIGLLNVRFTIVFAFLNIMTIIWSARNNATFNNIELVIIPGHALQLSIRGLYYFKEF
jgi:hypothetical protein